MEVVAADWSGAAKMETLFEEGDGLAFGALVCFFLADEDLHLMSQQPANRHGAAGGQDLGFHDDLAVEANRYILLITAPILGQGTLPGKRSTCRSHFTGNLESKSEATHGVSGGRGLRVRLDRL
jgi:hypothetical protein